MAHEQKQVTNRTPHPAPSLADWPLEYGYKELTLIAKNG